MKPFRAQSIETGLPEEEINMNVLKPRQPVPGLALSTLEGEWSLDGSGAKNFTMIVFYVFLAGAGHHSYRSAGKLAAGCYGR